MRRVVLGCALAVTLTATDISAAEPFDPPAFDVEVTGSGRPIIFIPGLACPGSVWAETVAHLAGYEAHVLTLAGFAGVAPIKEPINAATVRDLARYIRDRKLDHPIIVGHSLGGFIAYWLAGDEPDLVGPVISVDMSPVLDGGEPEAKMLRTRWHSATDKQFRNLINAKFLSMTKRPAKMKRFIPLIAKSDRRTIGDAVAEMVVTDLRPKLKAIKAPVLSIAANGGGRIRIHTKVIADHKLVVVPKTGHFIMWDAPDAFYKAIDGFLAAHPATR